jgi:hypothetical protein
MTSASIDGFVDRLASVQTGPGCHNFFDHAVLGNAQRRRNLETYLQEMRERRPTVLLLGEAPGFRGMRITGIPFTNRSILTGPANHFGLFGPGKGYVLPAQSPAVERLPLPHPRPRAAAVQPDSHPGRDSRWRALLAGSAGAVRHPDGGGGGERRPPQPGAKWPFGTENQAPGPRRPGRVQSRSAGTPDRRAGTLTALCGQHIAAAATR